MVTVTGWGVDPTYHVLICRLKTGFSVENEGFLRAPTKIMMIIFPTCSDCTGFVICPPLQKRF